MAISNLLQPKPMSFSTLQSPNKQYSTLQSKSATPAPVVPAPQATPTPARPVTGLVKPPVQTQVVAPLVPTPTSTTIPGQLSGTQSSGSTGGLTPEQMANAKTPEQISSSNFNSLVPTTPQPTTYSATNRPTYSGLVGTLANTALGNQAVGQSAAQIASDYGREYADIGKKGATGQAGYLSTGTTPVAEGNAAILAQTTAAQQQAVAQGEQAALLGTGQQLTAQNQTQTGLLNAANLTPEALRYGGASGGTLNPPRS